MHPDVPLPAANRPIRFPGLDDLQQSLQWHRAVSAGMRSAWMRQSESAIFDPGEMETTLPVSGLDELAAPVHEV